MHKRAGSCLPALLAATLTGCGYVGEPLPPSLNIPMAISDLRAVERGDRIVVEFTVPEQTTDGVGLGRVGVDLRVGAASENWLESSRKVETAADRPGAAEAEIPVKEWVGRDVVLGARVQSRKGRYSEWSNLVRLHVVEPLQAPSLKAEASAAGVRIVWEAPAERSGLVWRVFRRGPGRQEAELVGSASVPEFIDAAVERGAAYQYTVQAIARNGDAAAESEISKPAEITYEDRFPPAVPTGLAAIAGLNSIQLTWNPDTEPDLGGYHVYRSENGRPFARIGELLGTPSYTDRAVEAGRRYSYAVSAVDRGGNESARAEAVEVVAQ
jgi:fibronectin type 3 domain-containing protein